MSEFVEIKTAELTGAALDWAVAKAGGLECVLWKNGSAPGYSVMIKSTFFEPSTRWMDCGPLIEKYKVSLDARPLSGRWDAYCNAWLNDCDTPLIAASRAIVASVLGETVSVPKELV